MHRFHEAIKLQGLKFIHQNIRSIRGKLDELNILISQCPNLHILAFTETWLDNGIADGEISLPGYKIFRSDRPNGKGGGIAVYFKGSLSIIRRVDLEQQFPGECIFLEILLPKAKGILFGTFYRPPSQTDFMKTFRKINACKLPPRTIECRNYAKYNPSAFCDDLRDIPWDDVLKERNVNTAWSNWKELFLNVCDRHAPYKRKIVRGVKCPWLTGETKKLMNQRDFFLRKARRSGAEVDWNAYWRLRNQVSNKIRNEKRRYHRNEIQENLNSPKAFWKAIKKVFPSKKGNSVCPESIKTEEGHTITDKSTIAKKFNNFFTNAVSKLLETVQQPIVTREFSGDNFTDQKLCLLPVTESFVFKQLKGLKVKKATGLDRIPACLLKDSAAVITQSITFLVNLSLSTGIVPDEWKQARVVPLHKSGGREVMDNYRPISILPVISKIAEKAVKVQLQQYLNQHDLLNSFQSGFRRNHSTQTAVTYFCDTIRRSTDARKLTGALFIYLKKAFDTVPHDDLICKLKRFGLEENSRVVDELSY